MARLMTQQHEAACALRAGGCTKMENTVHKEIMPQTAQQADTNLKYKPK